MAWIKGNRYLSQSEMENNALIVYSTLASKGWTMNAIAGMLGNMQAESTINPAIWQSLIEGSGGGGGFGLVQWTPWTNFTNWADEKGYEWTDGDAQLKWIDEETTSFGQWIATSSYDITFAQFKTSKQSVEWLASAFLKNFERAGVEVEPTRQSNARSWYNFLLESGASTLSFTPRLDSSGMEGSKYYYSDNVFHQAGYGLPNCTCYAWGRQYEITDEKPSSLSTSDAGNWYPHAVSIGDSCGQIPQLGAVLCMTYEPSGHVAIVEKINDDGSLVISQSAYNGTYFWTETVYKSNNYLPQWAINRGGVFQGFIYLDKSVTPDTPDKPIVIFKKKKGYKFVLFNYRRRL